MAGVGAAERVYKAFGEQVRARRRTLRMTQLQFSQHIGLTRGSVANIEAGRQSVLLHQFLAIAGALQLSPEKLLPGQPSVVEATQQSTREPTDMPESVLNAIAAIRKTTRPRTQSRR